MTVSPLCIKSPTNSALKENLLPETVALSSRLTAEDAYKQLLDTLETLSSTSNELTFLSAQNSVSVRYECMQCVLTFWHVLDVRFTAVPDNKGRADVLLSWSAETAVWSNRRKTIVLDNEELAVYCVDRLRQSFVKLP